MSSGLSISLKDLKTGNSLSIGDEGTLNVVVHPHPPVEDAVQPSPFRQFFTQDGLSGGTSDMQVVGTASAPLDYFISASNEHDTFIKTISIVIADAGASLNKFGNITALTNGVEFTHVTADSGTIILHDALKSNFDFVQLAQGSPAFGDGTGAFRASNVSGTSEAYLPVIDLSDVFGFPYGLRLRKGTTDKLVFRVKDDTTGVDRFDIQGYGLQL